MCAVTVEVPLPYSVAVVTILWPFVQPFWRHCDIYQQTVD
jgi:hypothetical protein